MRRSPQEKKALSYARDRRNAYGENDKGSRKAIPLRKRKVNRANRHAARQQLDELGDRVAPEHAEHADRVEERVQGTKPKTWRKAPDEPLGQAVRRRLQRRAEQSEPDA